MPEPRTPTTRELVFREEPVLADAVRVRELVAATGFFNDEEIGVAEELVRTRLAGGEACGYFFWFAHAAGELAGYACYGPVPGASGTYDLYWIAVAPKFQGGGLGKKIAELVEASAARLGARSVYAETSGRERYAPTRRFYEKCGYRRAAVLEDFYGIGDDKVFYRKDMKGREHA